MWILGFESRCGRPFRPFGVARKQDAADNGRENPSAVRPHLLRLLSERPHSDMARRHDRQPADQRHGPRDGPAVPGNHQHLEADEHVRVVVFASAVDGYFLNHSDFFARLEDLTNLPAGSTGLPPWPDFFARLTRAPIASIALIRGRATGNGSEITLACDMSFASREKAILSQWEVGVGLVAGGGPMARLPQLIGRNCALEVLLSSEDISADQAEAYGYVNRALPDGELDAFVETLATRIAGFDKWAIANTKRFVNTSLPPDVELGAGWDTCIASLGRPAARDGIKALMARGFHKPGDNAGTVEASAARR